MLERSLATLALGLCLALGGSSASAQSPTPTSPEAAAVSGTDPASDEVEGSAPPVSTEAGAPEVAAALDPESAAQTETTSAAPSADTTDAAEAEPTPRAPLVYHLVVDIGFSHWLGNTFDAPIGFTTPSLMVHGVPIDWLEIGLSYAGSLVELMIPTAMRTSQIGFVELSLVLRKELRVGGDRLMLGCGPMVGLVYDVLGAGIAFGIEILSRYLAQVGDTLAVGPFIDVRATLYDLPGDPRPFYDVHDGKVTQGHLDAQIQLGVALAF